MNQDTAFIADIVAHPEDPHLRLIYADWLEEQGDPRSEYLRIQAELIRHREDKAQREQFQERLRRLRPQLDPDWLATMDRTRVELCHVPFEFQCPAVWEKMQTTDEPTIRFCGSCRKHVYYCTTLEQVRKHAGPSHCVAIDSSLKRSDGDTLTKVPGFPDLSFFFPPGTFVRLTTGEHAGEQGVVQSLEPGRCANVRLRREEGFTMIRVPLEHLECSDGTPPWGVGSRRLRQGRPGR